MKNSIFFQTLVLSLLIIASSISRAQDVDLVVTHTIKSLGTDGITRSAEFSERVVRRKDQIWTERIIPAEALSLLKEKNINNEKEFDTALASRWVVRRNHAKPELMLVSARAKLVVPIDKPDYENVGFDGSWESAYYLLDPKILTQMRALGARQADGGQWYESNSQTKRGESTQTSHSVTKIFWDETLKYPRQIESTRANKSDTKKMVATKAETTKILPWDLTKTYQHKNYADFLD